MRSGSRVGLMAALAVFGLATSASAKVLYVTYNGTITAGEDVTGEVFAAGTDLTGKAFEAVFKVDTANGTGSVSGGDQADIFGGSKYADSNPVVQATLLVGGHSVDFTGTYYSWAQVYTSTYFLGMDPGLLREMTSNSFNNGVTASNSILSMDFYTSTASPASLLNLFKGTAYIDPIHGNISSGDADFSTYDFTTGQTTHDFHATLTPTSVRVAASVPEPATWSMLLLGAGAAGSILRRRRRETLASSAAF